MEIERRDQRTLHSFPVVMQRGGEANSRGLGESRRRRISALPSVHSDFKARTAVAAVRLLREEL